MQPTQLIIPSEPKFGAIGEELDRLDVLTGKIGQLNHEQALGLLHSLDTVYVRIEQLEASSQSRKLSETQFEGIIAKLNAESSKFLRDLGGAHVLQEARAKKTPPDTNEWWFLDERLFEKRRAAMKRSLITAGVVVAVLAILAVVYQNFLAPDPTISAIYGYEQNAQDLMMNGDLEKALDQVNKGLQLDPADYSLLILRGVISESLGKNEEAAQDFALAQKSVASQEIFYLTRGQSYLFTNQVDKALVDADEASRLSPGSAQAKLLAGQVYETQMLYSEALDAYNLAFEYAEKAQQTEVAAVTRMRIAMLMQTMNAQILPQGVEPTAVQEN